MELIVLAVNLLLQTEANHEVLSNPVLLALGVKKEQQNGKRQESILKFFISSLRFLNKFFYSICYRHFLCQFFQRLEEKKNGEAENKQLQMRSNKVSFF